MVDNSPALDPVFHALSHHVRRSMLHSLADGQLTIGELAAPFDMSLEAASKHIRVLEHAGIVRRTVQGRKHVCTLEPGPLASASAWLTYYYRFWNEKLDAIEALFPRTDSTDKETT